MWKFLRLSPSTEKIGCEDNLSLQYSMLASKMVEREEEMQRQLVMMQIRFDFATTENANSMATSLKALHLEHRLSTMRTQHENDLKMANKDAEYLLAKQELSNASILALEDQESQHQLDISFASSISSLELAAKIAELNQDKVIAELEFNKVISSLTTVLLNNTAASDFNIISQEKKHNFNIISQEGRHNSEEKAVFNVYQNMIDEQKIKSDFILEAEKKRNFDDILELKKEFEIKLKFVSDNYNLLLNERNDKNIYSNENTLRSQ